MPAKRQRTRTQQQPTVSSAFKSDAIETAFFDLKLTLSNERDDPQYIRVKFDDETKKLLRNTLLGLQSSRKIIPDDQVSAMHPLIRQVRDAFGRYYKRLEEEYDALTDTDEEAIEGGVFFEQKSFEVPSVKEARAMVTQSMAQWQQDTFEDALKVCILYPNFVRTPTKSGGKVGYKIGFASHVPPVELRKHTDTLSQQDWDLSVVENGYIPLSHPDVPTEIDARVQLMNALFDQYPVLALRLNQVFEKLTLLLSSLAHGDTTLEVGDFDELGFRFVGMDTIMAELTAADADDNDDDGRQGTIVIPIPAAPDDTGDAPEV